jgi:nitrogen fixation/metabolism regulation signal transduction histidine kinase
MVTPTEVQQEYLGTSADLEQVPPSLGIDSGEGTASIEALGEQATSGETAPDTESRKKYYNAKAAFWKMMRWVVPIAITTAMAFYIYMLTSITRPIGKMQSDVEYLLKGNAELDNKIEKLPSDMLRSTGKTVEKIEADIENLRQEDAKVKMEIEKVRKEMETGKRDR